MEFIKANFLNTTTMLSVTNNTATSYNVYNRDEYYQYYTDGLNSDVLTGSMTITFPSPTNVSRIAMMDTNLKDFTIFYNGATANTFALTGANTTTSSFTGNASENLFFRFNTISVNSITIDMKKTQTANLEKILGLFVVSDLYYTMGQLPNSSGYKPSKNPKEIIHNMSDGGIRTHQVRNKMALNIDLDYLPQADVTSLKSIWTMKKEFNFAAFATSTGWINPVFFEAVWIGGFNFYEYSDDASVSGFSGKIQLRETSS